MIEFDLSDDERLIQRTARDFALAKLGPRVREHEASGVPDALVEEFRGLGLDAVGANLGPFAQVLVLEELGAVDAAAALALDPAAPARHAMFRLGDATQFEALLPGRRAALAVDLEGRLEVEGDAFTGLVAWCPIREPSQVVVLRTGGACLFESDGFRAQPVRALALDAAGGCEIRFERSEPAARLEGDPSLALAEVQLHVAGFLVGLLRASYEYVARYVHDRVTFGRPLAQHEAIAFYVVEMALAADSARLATWRAAHALQNGPDAPWAAAAALAEASESALAMTSRAVQLLGGHGYMKDHPVEKWMREARALTLAWGGPDALASTLSRSFEHSAEA
ncbi:MAG TPA: acyl-CoA dehydrogenase family protein [Myxococcales bacterium]|nr:acyl-CoA dehydrogenase family protein [Myxococcales bacterium]